MKAQKHPSFSSSSRGDTLPHYGKNMSSIQKKKKGVGGIIIPFSRNAGTAASKTGTTSLKLGCSRSASSPASRRKVGCHLRTPLRPSQPQTLLKPKDRCNQHPWQSAYQQNCPATIRGVARVVFIKKKKRKVGGGKIWHLTNRKPSGKGTG